MPLRFPNPGSDINRLVHIFRIIYQDTSDSADFSLDDMSRIMTSHMQASSRGAVGSQALSRSTGDDRSRDPLYNQSKSYSEVFRMLGWLRPTDQRLQFSITHLGGQIADDYSSHPDLAFGLLRECLIGVCFPNPATENLGIINQRPFKWLLQLAAALDGVITRHEMILGLLSVPDDLVPNSFENAVSTIQGLRGKRAKLMEAVDQMADASRIQRVTLENYTRFPVGVLKSSEVGWAFSGKVAGLYERPIEALSLTEFGFATAKSLSNMTDVRQSSLTDFPVDQQADFANFAYYAMLLRSGYQLSEIGDDLVSSSHSSTLLRNALGISDDPLKLLYSPIQQAPDEILRVAETR